MTMKSQQLLIPLPCPCNDDNDSVLRRPICSLCVLPCGDWVVIGSRNGEVLFMRLPKDCCENDGKCSSMPVPESHSSICDEDGTILGRYLYRILSAKVLKEYRECKLKLNVSGLSFGADGVSYMDPPVEYDKVIQMESLLDHLLLLPSNSSSLMILNGVNSHNFLSMQDLSLKEMSCNQKGLIDRIDESPNICSDLGIIDSFDSTYVESSENDLIGLVVTAHRNDVLSVSCLSKSSINVESSNIDIEAFDHFTIPSQAETINSYPTACVKISSDFQMKNDHSIDGSPSYVSMKRIIVGFGSSVTILECTLKKHIYGYNLNLRAQRVFSVPSSDLITAAYPLDHEYYNGITLCAASTKGTIFLWGVDDNAKTANDINQWSLQSIIEHAGRSITSLLPLLIQDSSPELSSGQLVIQKHTSILLAGDSEGCISSFIPSNSYHVHTLSKSIVGTKAHTMVKGVFDDLSPLQKVAEIQLQGEYRVLFATSSQNQSVLVANEKGEIKYFPLSSIPRDRHLLASLPNGNVYTLGLSDPLIKMNEDITDFSEVICNIAAGKDLLHDNEVDEKCAESSERGGGVPVPRAPLPMPSLIDETRSDGEDLCPRNIVLEPMSFKDSEENKVFESEKANENTVDPAKPLINEEIPVPSERMPVDKISDNISGPLSQPSLNSTLVQRQLIESKIKTNGRALSEQMNKDVAIPTLENSSKVKHKELYKNLVKIDCEDDRINHIRPRKVKKQVDKTYIENMKQLEPKLEDFLDGIPIGQSVPCGITAEDVRKFDRDASYNSDEVQTQFIQEIIWERYYKNLKLY